MTKQILLGRFFFWFFQRWTLHNLHRSTHIKDSGSLSVLACQVNCKFLVPLNIQALVNLTLHPRGLQAIALLWICVLEGLRRLLSIHGFSINCDPSMVLTKETISHFRCWGF